MKWDEYRDNFDGMPVFFIKKLVQAFGCVIQVHRFVKADAAGCFHSHPAWAVRIILWGGYVEETGAGRWQTWFPGRIGIVDPDFEHRIGGLRNGKSSWSLWLRGPKVAQISVRGGDEPSLSQADEDQDDIRDALMESQYLAGAKAGWNAAQADDPNAAYALIVKSREGYLAPITAKNRRLKKVTAIGATEGSGE